MKIKLEFLRMKWFFVATMTFIVGCCLQNLPDCSKEDKSAAESFRVAPEGQKTLSEKPLELKISSEKSYCVRNEDCKVSLKILNSSSTNFDGNALLLINLYKTNPEENYYRFLASIHIDSLQNLETLSESSKFFLEADQSSEKLIDLEKIEWFKSNQGGLTYKSFSERMIPGKYKLFIEMRIRNEEAFNPQNKDLNKNYFNEIKSDEIEFTFID